MPSRFVRLARLALSGALWLSACAAPSNAPRPEGGGVRLVATTPLVAELVQAVVAGVPEVTVVSLVPPGADPHDYEATPADARSLAQASLVVGIGVGYEAGWLTGMLKAAGNPPFLALTDGLPLRRVLSETPDRMAHPDPHIWMDPKTWAEAGRGLARQLKPFLSTHTVALDRNAEQLATSLLALDAELKEMVAALPTARRALVTSHDALGYYADRYGFTVVGAVIPSASTEAAPTARQTAALVALIRQHDVRAIFVEVGVNAQLVEAVAREAGVRVAEPLVVDTLTPAGGLAPTYAALLRYDTRVIVEALR